MIPEVHLWSKSLWSKDEFGGTAASDLFATKLHSSILPRNTLGIACQEFSVPTPPRPQNMCIYSHQKDIRHSK